MAHKAWVVRRIIDGISDEAVERQYAGPGLYTSRDREAQLTLYDQGTMSGDGVLPGSMVDVDLPLAAWLMRFSSLFRQRMRLLVTCSHRFRLRID